MTKLSVNINKLALIRNSRNDNFPDLVKFAQDCEEFGAQGITVHPRPDERHIRYNDIPLLRNVVTTEYNIEGYPSERFLQLVENNPPEQCTLVPDPPDVLTSSSGWETDKHVAFLKDVVQRLHEKSIRVSLFLNPDPRLVSYAKETGADRIELYTGDYAKYYSVNKENAVAAHVETSKVIYDHKMGLNAGHDLNLENLHYYKSSVLQLLEVSIGHALISDAIYLGLKNTIQLYLSKLK